jgi:hypothetical protein
MNPIEPDRECFGFDSEPRSIVIAKDQEEFLPLPSLQVAGLVVTQWEPTAQELVAILQGKPITIGIYTSCCKAFPPMRVGVGGMDFRNG